MVLPPVASPDGSGADDGRGCRSRRSMTRDPSQRPRDVPPRPQARSRPARLYRNARGVTLFTCGRGSGGVCRLCRSCDADPAVSRRWPGGEVPLASSATRQRMRRLTTVAVALLTALFMATFMATPAQAVDEVNTKRLRDAVTVAGILGHERVFQRIANQNGGTRA